MEEKKMSKTCEGCKNKVYTEEEKMMTVPYIAHQSAAARQERQIRRMWIALIVAIALMFFTNMIWVGVFSSYDYSSEEIIVDAEDNGNANYIGQDGNIYNGENNSAETQEN
jgi:uncharacterized paraquat-inducible protein A